MSSSDEAFNDALNTVHNALTRMQDDGRTHIRASKESLRKLLSTNPPPQSTKTAQPIALEKPVIASNNAPTAITPADTHLVEQKSDSNADKQTRIDQLRPPVLSCQKCPHLVRSRTQVVFGVGNIDADLMFVGEAPGADEDLAGEPFVGKAGQLLTKIIETMGFKRSDVYIANVLKCRPDMPPGSTGNRRPTPNEMATCLPYLREQIEIIRPKALIALGAVAMEGLLNEQRPMRDLRGRWHEFNGIPLMATYHPAYLLRNQSLSEKRKVWEDMLLVMERLNLPISDKQRQYFLPKA